YNAISYAWGKRSELTKISVDNKTMEVTQNCKDALEQAVRFNRDAWYWIDSVCIDQNNLGEKGHQVTRMHQIYRNAQYVLACVGQHADDSENLFRFIQDNQDALPCFRFLKHDNPTEWPLLIWREVPTNSETPTTLHDQLAKFVERPYFYRLWVYQEL
ncbi:hypothetical protein M406DRAFT_242633, partial [Cryphonectria parasitica EP155]